MNWLLLSRLWRFWRFDDILHTNSPLARGEGFVRCPLDSTRRPLGALTSRFLGGELRCISDEKHHEHLMLLFSFVIYHILWYVCLSFCVYISCLLSQRILNRWPWKARNWSTTRVGWPRLSR